MCFKFRRLMDGRGASKRGWVVGTLLLLLWIPRTAWTQEAGFWDKRGLWAEFVYTIRTWEKVVWTITPSVRTDEQEINSGFMTRVTTEATVQFSEDWDIRNRFFLIGRQSASGDIDIDERIQILLRKVFFRFHKDKIRFRGGLFYERHFRGDEIDDFNVYRTRLELRMDGIKNEPWVQQDFFFDHARGFFRTRTRAGLRLPHQVAKAEHEEEHADGVSAEELLEGHHLCRRVVLATRRLTKHATNQLSTLDRSLRSLFSCSTLRLTRRGVSAANAASRLIGGKPHCHPEGANQPFKPRTTR